MRMQMPREFYVPANAVKVCDKKSDAVAYLFDNRYGKPAAVIFFGKQSKPVINNYFIDGGQREKRVTDLFKGRQSAVAFKEQLRAKRVGWQNTFKAGDIFMSSYGYDQTNVDFFEVVSSTGKTLTMRKIEQDRSYTQSMAGQTKPKPGHFIGEEFKCRAQEHGVKVGYHQHARYVASRQADGTYGDLPSSYFSEYA